MLGIDKRAEFGVIWGSEGHISDSYIPLIALLLGVALMDDRDSWRHRHFGLVKHLFEGKSLTCLALLLHEQSRGYRLVYDTGTLQGRFVWLCGGVLPCLFLRLWETVVEQESIIACRLELVVEFVDGQVNVFHFVVTSS